MKDTYSVPEMLRLADKIIKERIIPSCVTCDHFDHRNEVCKIANGMRPPALVIARGCLSWRNDEIMF